MERMALCRANILTSKIQIYSRSWRSRYRSNSRSGSAAMACRCQRASRCCSDALKCQLTGRCAKEEDWVRRFEDERVFGGRRCELLSYGHWFVCCYRTDREIVACCWSSSILWRWSHVITYAIIEVRQSKYLYDIPINVHLHRSWQLRNGFLLTVPPQLIRRLKSHFYHIPPPCGPTGVDVILGLNGYVWVSNGTSQARREGGEGFDSEGVYSNQNDVSRIVSQSGLTLTDTLAGNPSARQRSHLPRC